ncbi:MAG: ATP-grasp domain-containing protein [Polyangiaceae bacterium]|nr:ATP-grasp domain-containing protein [Polyangiaceae bacterium]
MPCAIDEIRKLGERGHEIIASDTFFSAPGNHSRYATKRFVTPSPRHDTERFVAEIARIVDTEQVDLVLPAFEEVLFLAKHDVPMPRSRRFFPSFHVLETLQDKYRFGALARRLGLNAPEAVVVTSREDLRRAAARFGDYFAKPVNSRGGVDLLTNAGARAGMLTIEDCDVSKASPWLVQPYVEGRDVCTFSIVQHGVVTGHATYIHPREIEHSGGIAFESVDIPECVTIAQRIAAATHYHGQLSFDMIETPRGMVLIECNPRPTAGVHMMSPDMLEAALLDERGRELRVVPPGVRRKYAIALLRDMILHVDEAKEDAKYLFSDAKEVVTDRDDWKPAVYQVFSYGRVIAYRRKLAGKHERKMDLKKAYFEDVSWDGSEPTSAPTSRRAVGSAMQAGGIPR